MKNNTSSWLTFSILSILFWNCTSIKKITCEKVVGNKVLKETVIIQKHPERFYQDYVSKADLSLKASINVLDKIKIADLDGTVKKNVTVLREKLDQYSGRIRDYIKLQYSQIQEHPCDSISRRSFEKWLSDNSKRNDELEKLNIELSSQVKSGQLKSQSVQDALKKFKDQTNDTSLHFTELIPGTARYPWDNESNLAKGLKHERGWYNDKEVNGAKRIATTHNIDYFPSSYYDTADSLDLSNDFLIESNVRSLKADHILYGLVVNKSSNPDQPIYFLLSLASNKSKPTILIGIDLDARYSKFEKVLFSEDFDVDPTNYHKLQIKKSGDYIKFFLNESPLYETHLYTIRTIKLGIFISSSSDVLIDYLSYRY